MLCSWGDLWTTKMSLCEVIQFDGWRTSRMSIKAFPLHTCTAVLSLWYCCYWVLWICLLFTNGKEIYFIYKFLVYKLIQCDPKFSLQDRPCPRLTVSLQALLSSGSRHSKEWRPEQVVWSHMHPSAPVCSSTADTVLVVFPYLPGTRLASGPRMEGADHADITLCC